MKFLLSIFEKMVELNKNNIYGDGDGWANLLMDNMIYIISKFNNNIQTNYLAVAFEWFIPIICTEKKHLDKYILFM